MAYSKNQWIGIGNLTRDAEGRNTQGGKYVLNFAVACNERYQDQDGNWKDGDPLYLDVEFWGAQAEKIAASLVKGATVFVDGKLKIDKWDDKQTGEKRSKVKATAFTVMVIAKQDKTEGGQNGPRRPAPQREEQRSLADQLGEAGF